MCAQIQISSQVRGFTMLIGVIAMSVIATNAVGQVQTDIVFLIDRSNSLPPPTEQCLYDFQLAAVAELICGGNCSQENCTDSLLPHDGTVAISMVTFGRTIGLEVVKDKEVITSASAPTICGDIRNFPRLNADGGTPLGAALNQARTMLEARPSPLPQGFERLVIVLSDADSLAGLAGDPFAPAEALRTLNPPARISCFRFSDNPFGTDPDCNVPREQEVLVEIANAADSPNFRIDRPRGEFVCRTICPCDQPCPASPCNPGVPPNCEFAQADIDAFVDLVRRSLCSLGLVSQLSITQQTQQSPSPATIVDSVTLSVQATSSGFGPYYQWRLDGLPIVGASGNTLAVDRLNLCETGQFDCLVLGAPCDEVASNSLVLDIDASGDDCNTNGIPDTCEFALGYDWTGTIGGGDHDTTGGTDSGSGSDLDFAFGHSVTVDANGNVIYTGSVRSNTFNIDVDPTDTVLNYNSGQQQNEDWFVTKLTPGVAGAPAFSWNVLASTEFPGEPGFGASERGYCIDADPATGAIVVAATMRDAVDAEFDLSCTGGNVIEQIGLIDTVITRFDSDGQCQWARSIASPLQFGPGIAFPLDIEFDLNGDVIVTGHFNSSIDFDPGPGTDTRTSIGFDAFITKLNGINGSYQWTHIIRGDSGQAETTGTGIAVDSNNNIFITGYFGFASSTDFNPEPVCGGPVGDFKSPVSASFDVFVTKLSAAGCYQWTETIGDSGGDYGLDIAIDENDALIITGTYSGVVSFDPSLPGACTPTTDPYCHQSTNFSRDAFVLKLDNDGSNVSHAWSKSFGGIQEDVGTSIALDPEGNVLVSGYFCRFGGTNCSADFDPDLIASDIHASVGDQDMFVMQINSNGSYGSSYVMGGPDIDEGHGIAVDSAGNVWVAAIFAETVDFDPSLRQDFQSAAAASGFIQQPRDVSLTRFASPPIGYADCDGNNLVDTCDMTQCCGGDINRDSVVDAADIQLFIDLLLDPPSCAPILCPADLNTDGIGLNILDLPQFVNSVVAGAPCGPQESQRADCNANDTDDLADIFLGSSEDCNNNGVPDECEIDENSTAPGGPFHCQQDCAQDSNDNGVPDDCEPDCNENGRPDDFDIANQTSNDANTNGVPDDCEPDCNTNGVPDAWDISQATSADCNTNGTPDECEQDCNSNGVPDNCDIDPSDPDGDAFVSADCNANGWPDECDLSLPPGFGSLDCNTNGTPDECDIAACESDPACDDCNANGIPDGCDIAAQISEDANSNGIPDECESQQAQGGGGGGEAMASTTGGGSEESTGGTPMLPDDAAWAEFWDWSIDPEQGANPLLTSDQKFTAMVAKMQELGLPVMTPYSYLIIYGP